MNKYILINIILKIFLISINFLQEINHNNPTFDVDNAGTITYGSNYQSDSDYSFSDYYDSDLDEINE